MYFLYLPKPPSLFLANGFCVEMEAIADRLLCQVLDLQLINIVTKYLKGCDKANYYKAQEGCF